MEPAVEKVASVQVEGRSGEVQLYLPGEPQFLDLAVPGSRSNCASKFLLISITIVLFEKRLPDSFCKVLNL